MSRFAVYSFVLCLLCFHAKGQSLLTVQGVVTDTTGRPIPMASVSLTEEAGSSIRAFSNTNNRGQYRFTLPTPTAAAYTLTVRALGYTGQTIRLESNNVQSFYTTELRPAVQTLKEVLVRAPIVQRNDTTSFDLKQFADTSSSEKLESVLKRLPGFDVSEGGQLYFKGKRVEKVLLDGDDLFDDRYAIATRSLRASMIDRVQTIEGYQKNQLLKGFKQSDQVAVNLVVRPEKRKLLSGSADLTTNVGSRYRAQLNAISYTRSVKGMWIGDVSTITAESTSPDASRQTSGEGEKPMPSPLHTTASNSLDYVQPTGLRASRFLDSRMQSGAASLTTVWNKSVKSSAYLVAYNNQGRFSQSSDEHYLRSPVVFAIREQQANSQMERSITGQHELTVDVSKQTQVVALTRGTYVSRDYEHTIASSLTNTPIQEQLGSMPVLFVQRVSGTHRVSERHAVQASVQYAVQRLDQSFLLPILKYADTLAGIQYRLVQQNNEIMRRELSGALEWHWRSKSGFSGSVENDLTHTWQQQYTTLLTAPKDSTRMTINSQSFELIHQLNHLRATLRRTLNRTQIALGITGSFARALYHQTKSHAALVGPVLTVRHTFSSSSQLVVSYRYDLSDQTLQHYYPGALVTSYRSSYRGLDTTAFWGEHLVFASFNKQDLLANRRFGLTAIVSHRANALRSDLSISPYQIQQQMSLAGRAQNFINLTGTAEQLIVPLNIVLKGNTGYSSLTRYNRINGQDQIIRSIGRHVGLELNTVFNKPFTVNLSSQYAINETQLAQTGIQRVLSSTNWLIQEKVVIKIDQFRVRLNGQQFFSYSGGTVGNSRFFDAYADYSLKRKGFTIGLECRNLLDEQQYIVQTVGDLSVATTRYDMLGRWFLINLGFPF